MAVDAHRIPYAPRRCSRLALGACTIWGALLLLGPVAAVPPSSVRLNLVDDFLDKGWTARCVLRRAGASCESAVRGNAGDAGSGKPGPASVVRCSLRRQLGACVRCMCCGG